MQKKHIALVIGSLRRDSINRKVAQYIQSIAPASWVIDEVHIGDLPVYNQDFDAKRIEAYEQVRTQIKQVDAVLFVTPEHNRSIPAAVKNLLDIASRPAGQSAWTGKLAAVVCASPSTFGGLSSGLHLRQVLEALGVQVMISPEVFLSKAFDLLNKQGEFANERSQAFVQKFVVAWDVWLDRQIESKGSGTQ